MLDWFLFRVKKRELLNTRMAEKLKSVFTLGRGYFRNHEVRVNRYILKSIDLRHPERMELVASPPGGLRMLYANSHVVMQPLQPSATSCHLLQPPATSCNLLQRNDVSFPHANVTRTNGRTETDEQRRHWSQFLCPNISLSSDLIAPARTG